MLKTETVFMAIRESQSKDLVGCSPGAPDGPTMLTEQLLVRVLADRGRGETSYFLT